MFDPSGNPWYVDLGIIAGVLVSLGTIWRLAIWPGLKTFWLAVVAAPKIADGVGKVVELIESDVLLELRSVKDNMTTHLVEAEGRDSRIAEHEKRLGKLEDFLFTSRKDDN